MKKTEIWVLSASMFFLSVTVMRNLPLQIFYLPTFVFFLKQEVCR